MVILAACRLYSHAKTIPSEAKNVAAHKELAQNSRFLEELQNKRGELLRSKVTSGSLYDCLN
jgi:hypothetical protein